MVYLWSKLMACSVMSQSRPPGGADHNLGVQVHKAFEYLQKAEEVDKPDRWYDVRVKRTDSTQPPQRGVYLRDPWHSRRPVSFTCEIKPNMRRVCSLPWCFLEQLIFT